MLRTLAMDLFSFNSVKNRKIYILSLTLADLQYPQLVTVTYLAFIAIIIFIMQKLAQALILKDPLYLVVFIIVCMHSGKKEDITCSYY